MPAVARLPFGLIVYFAPRGPNDSDAVLLDRFSVTPGASLTLRQKRKLILLSPNPRHSLCRPLLSRQKLDSVINGEAHRNFAIVA